jgi:hypothetical protein
MKPRTEDDVIARTPITTKFGDKEYSIALLAVLPQREWRKKLFAELAPILATFDFKVDGQSMADGLTAALLTFPEKLSDLVFDYAPELSRDEILAAATEEQMTLAFSAIAAVAFPFLPQIAMVRQLMRSAATSSQA